MFNKIMKRPLPVDNSHINKKINGCDKQQRKHSLRNSILKPNLKKRRRASNRIISTWIKRKTKRRSKLNNSSLKNNTNRQTPRVSYFFHHEQQFHLNERQKKILNFPVFL